MKVRWTNSQLEQLDAQILEVLRADNPQSVRHVFYRMTDPRLPAPVPKDDSGYDRVQRRCKMLRESGRLPYSWIADFSRAGYIVEAFTDIGDFLESVAGLYRLDVWHQHGVHAEVWCESLSIASVIRRLCNRWGVSLFPTRGFSSLSFTYEAARNLEWRSQTTGKAHLFYIGDYDPAGQLIDADVESKLRHYLPDTLQNWLRFERIAINEQQIAEYDLPTKPRKKSEKRKPEMALTVEAEAMPAGILRDLLDSRISSLLPDGALDAALVAEESERRHIFSLAA